MRNNKKKGFTLMELLATVVILGIISTIGIVSVNKVLDKSHKEYEVKQAKMVTTAAQSYFADNKSMLPLEVLTTKTVTLQELINNNYIDEVVDYKKEKYDYDKSITTVRKMAANRYVYYSKLIRQDGSKAVDENPENIKSSTINITLGNYDTTNTFRKNAITSIYYVNGSISIPISITGTEKIAAYNYKIKKRSTSDNKAKVYKKSENIVIDNKSYQDKIKLSKESLADGKYQVEFTAYDYNGQTSVVNSDTIVIDATKPKCEISLSGTKGNNEWYIGNITLKMKITEQNPYKNGLSTINNMSLSESSSKEKTAIQQTSTSINGKKWYGKIEDKAGNTNECDTMVYLDKTKPNCSVIKKTVSGSIIEDQWTNSDYVATRSCADSNSGCSNNSFDAQDINVTATDGTVNNNIINFGNYSTISDNAGNTNTCSSFYAKIDKEKPTCSFLFNGQTLASAPGKGNSYAQGIIFSNTAMTYFTTDVSITIAANDNNGSGINENSKTPILSLTDGMNSWINGSVKDNVGNEGVCAHSVPEENYIIVDKTPPSCPNITANRTARTWINNNVEFSFNFSGTDIYKYNWYTNINGGQYTDFGTNPNTTTKKTISADGYRIGRIIGYDAAGNSSGDCYTDTYWIDQESPDITATAINKKTSFSTSGCGRTIECVLHYSDSINSNNETIYHGVKLDTYEPEYGESPIVDWGAQAKYQNGGVGCNWGDGIDYVWSGAAVCTSSGTGKIKRCYKVKDAAGNTSARICSCQAANDGKVTITEPNYCFSD